MKKYLDGCIENVKVFSYSIPFKEFGGESGSRGLIGKNGGPKVREGLVIELKDSKGIVGYGEIAPLEGFNSETLLQVKEQVYELGKNLPGTSIKEFDETCTLFSRLLPGVEVFPSVKFGVETAGLNILYRIFDEVMPEPEKPLFEKKIRVNGLLPSGLGVGELRPVVDEILKQGMKTIKVKVGRRDMDEDIELIRELVEILPQDVRLRLDANGCLDYETAVKFGKALGEKVSGESFIERIDYIEEPFAYKSNVQFTRFYEETGIGVGLDESLLKVLGEKFRVPKGVCAFVIKPTILGGMCLVMNLFDVACLKRIPVVVSSCFECGPGFIELCKMITLNNIASIPAGLDTFRYLGGDLFLKPIVIENGCIDADAFREPERLYDFGKMKLEFQWP